MVKRTKLVERVEARLKAIPAHNPGVISSSSRLGHHLSKELIRLIATAAVDEILKEDNNP